MYVTITVLQEDINAASRDPLRLTHRSGRCPVAYAGCRTLGVELGNVVVGGEHVWVFNWRSYPKMIGRLPKRVQDAMSCIDSRETMVPLTFRINLNIESN